MNTIFKYNANAKYSAKDLRGGHNRNNFSLLDVYLDEKRPSVKIQPPHIFKKHEIFLEAATHFLKYKKYVQKELHKCSRLLHKIYIPCMKIFIAFPMVMKTPMIDGFKILFRNPTALYKCHQPTHNAYHNRQIIQACFARMSPCLDHRP